MMRNAWRIAIVVGLLAAVAGVLALKANRPVSTPVVRENSGAGLPRLLELGGSTCKMCQLMKPVLEELRTEYAGKLRVEAVDVFQNPKVGNEYGIRLIPTQIFFDKDGKEVFRHTGFFPKDQIERKLAEMGVK